jgi:hypothetical protein
MKKLLLLLLLAISAISFGGIFKRGVDSADFKYALTHASAKNWDKTIEEIIKQEAYIEDWYGDDNVIIYLRKTGIMKEKDFQFLQSLSTKEEYEITGDEYDDFVDLVDKYRKKVARTFSIKNENIKNPVGLVRRIVLEGSAGNYVNPSSQIKLVATPQEWDELVTLSKLKDFSNKETKRLRKVLNDVLKKDNLFNAEAWYNREVSARVKKIIELDSGLVGKRERNNINAKALYIAYPDFLSRIDKWGK